MLQFSKKTEQNENFKIKKTFATEKWLKKIEKYFCSFSPANNSHLPTLSCCCCCCCSLYAKFSFSNLLFKNIVLFVCLLVLTLPTSNEASKVIFCFYFKNIFPVFLWLSSAIPFSSKNKSLNKSKIYSYKVGDSPLLFYLRCKR